MRDYKTLEIYRKAYALTLEIYEISKEWPKEEIYGLTAQLRQSAHSVNTNICEGVSRGSDAYCIRFLYIAYASLKETENHIQLARDVGYILEERYVEITERIDHLSRMINNFIKSASYRKAHDA